LILLYFKEKHSSLYSKMTYYLIDSFPILYKHQIDALSKNDEYKGKVKFILEDLIDISTREWVKIQYFLLYFIFNMTKTISSNF